MKRHLRRLGALAAFLAIGWTAPAAVAQEGGANQTTAERVRKILDLYRTRTRWGMDDPAFKELIEIGRPAVVVLLEEMERMGKEEAEAQHFRRVAISEALKALCTKQDAPQLRRLIADCDGVAFALGKVEGVAAIPALVGALKAAPDDDPREDTTEVLGYLLAKEAVPVLVDRLKKHSQPPLVFLGQNEAWSLGNIGDPAAAAVLKEWTAKAIPQAEPDYRDQLKRVSAEALMHMGDPEGLDAMIECLASKEEYTRENAIQALNNATGTTQDFRADAPEQERAKAVDAWRRWRKGEGKDFKPEMDPDMFEGIEPGAAEGEAEFTEDNAATFYKAAFDQMVDLPDTGETWEEIWGIVRYGWIGAHDDLASILSQNAAAIAAVEKGAALSKCYMPSSQKTPFWEREHKGEDGGTRHSFKGYDLSRLLVSRGAQLEREGKREEAVRLYVTCVKMFRDLTGVRDRRYAPGYTPGDFWFEGICQAQHLALDSLERLVKQPSPDGAFGRRVLKELDRISTSDEAAIPARLRREADREADWDDIWDRHTPLTTHLAALRIMMALQVYKAEKGAFEDTLDALAPGILDKVPVDPVSGEPFRYECTEDGWRLWAVGPDKKDDGGEVPYDPDTGKGDILFTSKTPRPSKEFLQEGKFSRDDAVRLLTQERGIAGVHPDPSNPKRTWIILKEGSVGTHDEETGQLQIFEDWPGYARYVSSLKLSRKDATAILLFRKKVASEIEDPVDPGNAWLVLENGPLCLWTESAKQLDAFENLMGYPRLRVNGIVPVEDGAWVATDRDLLRYDRKTRTWYRSAVGGDASLLEVNVLSITRDGAGKLRLKVECQGRPQSYSYDLNTGRWEKVAD